MELINPDNPKKIYWELVILFLTVICTFIYPLVVIFERKTTTPMIIFDVGVTIFFAVDIFLNFHTAYEEKRKLVTDKKRIARRYLRTWFPWDLIATLPLALLFSGFSGLILSRLFRLFRLTRLFKLFSSNKTLRRLNEMNNAINPSVIRMIIMVFWILVAAHLVSCGWIALGGIAPDQTKGDTYLQAFYWTITTLTTIGYGDISPDLSHKSQIIFTIITQLLGAGMYGFIIGNISNLIANMDVAKSNHKEKVERINDFLKYKNIPAPLQRRVSNYYDYLWESRRGYNEAAVIEELPHSLKMQITIQMNKELIQKVPLFEHAPDSFLKEVILNLEPVIFTPGDYIMEAGEMGYEMYFISSGKVDVLSADENITYATLTGGAFIGEMALLLSTPRTATVKAVEYCDLYRLTKDMVDSILPRYPEIEQTMSREAERRRLENEAKIDHSHEEESEQEEALEEKVPSPADQKILPSIDEAEFSLIEGEDIVKIRWKEMDNVNYYQVLKKNPSKEKWSFAASQLYTPEFIDLHPLKSGRNIYKLRAVNENGPGPWSKRFYFSFEEGAGAE
ncbi:MAG: ion transporter [Spirochaetales bacterium]|nr:ion transporter [Spirochaetales bacterium]